MEIIYYKRLENVLYVGTESRKKAVSSITLLRIVNFGRDVNH